MVLWFAVFPICVLEYFMAHAIFTTKSDSGYDDVREERYHFPSQYLARVQKAVGDLIIYYEPRRGNGRLSYIAVARVDHVDQDPTQSGHYYARITDYVNFDNVVPFRQANELFESSLRGSGETGLSGEFRNAVRLLPNHEFEAILAAGFANTGLVKQQSAQQSYEFAEEGADFTRSIVEQLVRRPFREAAFARQVKAAYGNRCAFTGLDMRNGGGRAEVDAAHIKPVGDGHNGPDSIRNGLAITKTVHWMFDRGLLSIDSDYKILVANPHVPEPILRLLEPSGHIIIPDKAQDRPHPAFLEYHRNNIFKEAKAGV
ncbi:MAG TPA: HNH endonuclease [Rhizomicrobium sp.]|nr:HNH endonuclease [Rhizomicrobium sp.]